MVMILASSPPFTDFHTTMKTMVMLSPSAAGTGRRIPQSSPSTATRRGGGRTVSSGSILWLSVSLIVLVQLALLFSFSARCGSGDLVMGAAPSSAATQQPPRPVGSFWWPSPETDGGFLSAINRMQHPDDCRASKFLVMQSKKNNEGDNRGLSAWASITYMHAIHAFGDGDDPKLGRRVLVNDERLWPMAKNCRHGPETRECFFLPLSSCGMGDVDAIGSSMNAAELEDAKEDYDRSIRTIYTSPSSLYARNVKDQTSWSGLPGQMSDHSQTALTAAFLAYTLNPQPWLREEIDRRLRRSVPPDLDPRRTVGVPIRRSDKCMHHNVTGSAGGELDCPPLEQYLDAVRSFVKMDPLIRHVIVTSEDPTVCPEFIRLVSRELPQLTVVQNVGDVQQGTGSASKLESYKATANNEDVIASAMTSLHLHLRARYFVLTTKSSWSCSISILARIYGVADIYTIDIGRNRNMYSQMARRGG